MLPDIIHLRFDADTHPDAAERIAAWSNVMSLSVDVTVRPEHRSAFAGSLDFYPLGSVLLVVCTATPQTMSRSRRTIARTGDGQIIFDIFTAGGFTGVFDGCSMTIRPGDCFLMDYGGTMRIHLSDNRYIGVVIPRPLWDQHARVADVHGLRLDATSPEAQLLAGTLEALVRQAPGLTAARAAALGIGLVGLIGACVTQEEPPPFGLRFAPHQPTLIRIRHYIEQHAADPRLDAELIAEVFELSRSALYRVCRADGGVASLIRWRRVEIARALFAEAGEPPCSDDEIARRSGFAGLRALKRALHDLHATTPLRLRRAALDPELAASQRRIEVSALLDR